MSVLISIALDEHARMIYTMTGMIFREDITLNFVKDHLLADGLKLGKMAGFVLTNKSIHLEQKDVFVATLDDRYLRFRDAAHRSSQ